MFCSPLPMEDLEMKEIIIMRHIPEKVDQFLFQI